MNSDDKIEKRGPFMVPGNYFDEVNRKILDSTSESRKPEKFILPSKFRPLLAIAAAIAVIVMLVFLAGNLLQDKDTRPELSEIIVDDPALYADELDITFIENNSEITGFSYETGLSNNEIIDYLVAEEVDELLIFEKL